MDVFAWVDWQGVRTPGTSSTVVRVAPGGVAPATVNRRVAAVRAFFEFLTIGGTVPANPVPSHRDAARACARPHAACSATSAPGGRAATDG